MFHLKIKTENAAFSDGNRGAEIARILRDLAGMVENAGDTGEYRVSDINGNSVGTCKITNR